MGIRRADELFSEAYAYVDQALCYDEIKDKASSMEMYERGLELIEDAERERGAKKSEMYTKMMHTKRAVVSRLEELGQDNRTADHDDSSHNENKEKIREQLDEIATDSSELLFSIPGGVQLFMIEGDETTLPTYPTSLEIRQFDETAKATVGAEAFIQVGPWIYPLKKAPVLRNDVGAYVFPNATPENPEMCVGLILPSDLDRETRQEFDDLLNSLTTMRSENVKRHLSQAENKRLSKKIAYLVIKSSEWLASGIGEASNRASAAITAHYAHYRTHNDDGRDGTTTSPTAPPLPNTEPMSYQQQRTESSGANSSIFARFTKWIFLQIYHFIVWFGRFLMRRVEKQLGGPNTQGARAATGAMIVLGGGVAGLSTVWSALENASKTLCQSIANETLTTVRDRYGDTAATGARIAMFAAGHSSLAAYKLASFGPRTMIGRMAEHGGKEFVREMEETSTSTATAGSRKRRRGSGSVEKRKYTE